MTDPATQATRRAANAAALSVVAYAVLWFATTQVAAIRDGSPFGDDPWDLVASYAVIFLPVVAGATWIRSLRHRGPQLEPALARRIRWGSGLAVAIVLTAVGTDVIAIARVSTPSSSPLIDGLVAIAGLAAIAAAGLLVRAQRTVSSAGSRSIEPEVVDDALALVAEVAGKLGMARPVGDLESALQRFLDRSALSPRRHRILFGVLLALAASVAFDVWHGFVEGPSGSPGVLLLFGALAGGGVLAVSLATLVPLRLLRPVGR
jgi:hypothetical protein